MSKIEIHRADASHIADIYKLEQACFSQPWPLEILYEDICVNNNPYYVLSVNGEVVGYAGMWLILDEAHINNICVQPEHRLRGYGKLLLDKLIWSAYKNGADSITLEVRASNEAAINLYKKFGFEIEGLRKRYYEDTGEDAFIMWKQGISQEMSYRESQ